MTEKISQLNRRHFLLSATVLAVPGRKLLAANDKPGIALIGCGSRGRQLSNHVSAFGNILAVCDVDEERMLKASAGLQGAKPYKDFRKVLERTDIDIVVNATPDHWHTLINLAAVNAGKDVYTEKPLTLTIEEGRRLVNAVKKNKRILQTGSQQRNSDRFRIARDLVRSGRIGKLKHITVGLPKGAYGGPFKPSPAPRELDWDFWLGQTPKVEYVKERCHFNYRHWYNYSSGPLTDWGGHHNDIVLWTIGDDNTGPVSVEGSSFLDPVPGGYDVHSQFRIEYLFPNGVRMSCVSVYTKQFGTNPLIVPTDMTNGVRFEGTDGWLLVSRAKIEASTPELLTPEALEANNQKGDEYNVTTNNHLKNFFECVRSRKQPICDAEVGHRAASMGHLGAISLRLGGRDLKWDPAKEQFIGDKEADRYLAREQRKNWSYRALGI